MSDRKKNELISIRFIAANIVIPLIIGLLMYICINQNALIIRVITRVNPNISNLSITGRNEWEYIFVRCYAADILWAYALTISVGLVLRSDSLIVTFIISVAFLIVIELLQLTNLLNGTFDIVDILMELLASLLALLVLRKFKENGGTE